MTFKRPFYLLPQEVTQKIVSRYGYEKLGEFSYLIGQYCAYWDNFETGEGFDFSIYSEAVLIYFDTVIDEIDEKHRQYILKGDILAINAKKGREKKEKEEKRREQKRNWYVNNSEKINAARRQNVSSDGVVSEKQMSSGVSSDISQGQSGQGLAKNGANRIQNYEIMNHKNNINYDSSGACGFVDKSDNQIASLSGHNRPDGSVINENYSNLEPENVEHGSHKNHKNHKRRKNHKKRRTLNNDRGSIESGNIVHNPPQALTSQLPQGSECSARGDIVSKFGRETIYSGDWIVIGDDFEVDFFDEFFKPFNRSDEFLTKGFEMWIVKKFSGQKKDKWWLAKQFKKFAHKQGKTEMLTQDWRRG